MIHNLNNKYLLSVLLCLLSATAAKANTKGHQLDIIDSKIKSERNDEEIVKLGSDRQRESEISRDNLGIFSRQSENLSNFKKETNSTNATSWINQTISADKYSLDRDAIADNSLGQITNVSQLKDVSPSDWAYEALRSLSERYNCVSGFADGTFGGEQTLTRYQFAAGLNSCLQQIESLIASSETVSTEDLQTVEKLSQEFETELAGLAGRVDNLETRIATLEDNQFSTTTILNGEVIFALADAWGGNPPGGCDNLTLNLQNDITANAVNCGLQGNVDNPGSTADEPDSETTFAYFARLGLQASFSGQDRLRMFLTTGNFNDGGFTSPEAFNTYSPRFSYQAGLENQVVLDILEYRLPAFNDRVAFYASGFGFSLSNVLTANSPFFDIGRGSVSRFGQLNPIFRIGGPMDAGVGFDWLIAEPIRLQVAYGTRDSAEADGGFFGADYSTLGAQFLVQPTDNIVTGITYVNAYSSDGSLGTFTGSVNAETNGLWSGGRLPTSNGAFPGRGVEIGDFPAQTNAVGGTFQWNFTEQLNFGASAAYAFTDYLDEIPEFDLDGQIPGVPAVAGDKPFGETLTYQVSLGFSDPFGREGDLFGFIFGMPPKLVDAGPVTPGQTVPFSEQVINNEDAVAITDNDPRQFLTANDELGDPDNDFLIQEGTIDQFGREDEATSLHFEFFYRYKANDSLWITPGFFFVTNPGHIAENDTIYVGTLRTTFRF